MYKSGSMKRLSMEITVTDGKCHISLLKSQWEMYLAFVLLPCCVAMVGSWLQMFWSNTLVKQFKKKILFGLLDL